jgi:hypothetical protein
MSVIKFGAWQDLSGNEVANSTEPIGDVGLVLIKSQTIGSGVSSVSVSDVFSSTYDNYRILVTNADASNNATLLMLQIGGSGAHNYAGIQMINNSDTQTVIRATNASGLPMGLTWTVRFSCWIDVMAPFITTFTTCMHPVYGSAGRALIVGGSVNDFASYTGFTIAPAAGTLTGGTVQVYGYRN